MDYKSEPFSVMTIDGLHYEKSVIVSDNPYELTLLCDTLWDGEVFDVPATVVHEGKEYIVTGIDVGQSSKLENLRELRIPSTRADFNVKDEVQIKYYLLNLTHQFVAYIFKMATAGNIYSYF